MKNNQIPDIVKRAERLLLDIEKAVKSFPRYHKYTIGTDVRNQAMTVVRISSRAWRDISNRGHWLSELIWSVDELKISLQLGSQLRVFKSFAQFEQIIRQAAEVGACAGGWKRNHQKSQNSDLSQGQKRAQILSGRSASVEQARVNL